MFTVMYLLLGLLLVGVSVPLIQRRVRPNPWYGFRTPKTLESETVWYDANEFSGRMLRRAGYVTLIGVGLLAFFPLSWGVKALADAAVMLLSVLWASAMSPSAPFWSLPALANLSIVSAVSWTDERVPWVERRIWAIWPWFWATRASPWFASLAKARRVS